MAAPNPLKFGVTMLTQEQKTILGKPGYCISFLAVALSSRSLPTFCELLVASMITAECFVTQSWFQGRLLNFWGSYHKWLETGCWRSYRWFGDKCLVIHSQTFTPCTNIVVAHTTGQAGIVSYSRDYSAYFGLKGSLPSELSERL